MPTQLITGANRGIGLAHVRLALEAGDTVYAGVRDPDSAADLRALTGPYDTRLHILTYDARDPDAAAHLRTAVGDVPIDILLANAGIYGPEGQSLGRVDAAGFADTLQINTLAPLLLAEAFADQVAASELKVIGLQSSRMGSIEDNGSGGYYAYRASKAALNAVTRSLARDLAGRGIKVLALHPGWVRTRMGGPSAPVEVDDSARAQQDLLKTAGPDRSGGFWNFDGARLPW
jgi:NAD(P)-dependent dehydrogenase (short-subunit alcohol dehydrogenase family)